MVALAVAASVVVVASPPRPALAEPETSVPVSTVDDLVIDPGTGRVFASGDDAVAVLAPDGTLVKLIGGIAGARGLDATQGSVWALATETQTVVRIDPVAMEVVDSYPVYDEVGQQLTVVGDVAWFGELTGSGGIARFDLSTSEYEHLGVFQVASIERIPGTTSEILVYQRGSSGGSMRRMATDAPYGTTASGRANSYLRMVDIDDAADRVFTAAANPPAFSEFDAATLTATGTQYLAESWPHAIGWSPAHGGLLVGAVDDALYVYLEGRGDPIGRISRSDASDVAAIEVAADGTTAFVVDEVSNDVQRIDLRPAIDEVAPATVVADVRREVTVAGRTLGGSTAVRVGGVPATIASTTPTSVTFEVPDGVAVGDQVVAVDGPTGTATATIAVEANVGAALSGRVSTGGTPGGAATLTLTGGDLAAPLTTTTAGDGTYAFPPVGQGDDYVLSVADDAAIAPDQRVARIALTPNEPSTVDVDLWRPAGPAPLLARSRLAVGAPNDLVVDAASGRVVVAGLEGVALHDADGAPIVRFDDLDDVRSIALADGDAYLGLATAQRIVRIDLATGEVTGSWPLGTPTNGSIAVAGGKVWFAAGINQWMNLAALDPASGDVAIGAERIYYPLLETIEGDPDRFIASSLGISNRPSYVIDGSGDTAEILVERTLFNADVTPTAPLVASAVTGHVYDARGHRFDVGDLGADELRHPGEGPPAFAPALGGVVAIGATVSAAGTDQATHAFGGEPATTALHPDGDRLYGVIDGQLVVDDLSPLVEAAPPTPLYPGDVATVVGSGLGMPDMVTLDGAPLPVASSAPGSLEVDLAGIAPGTHNLSVTTAWGTSDPLPLQVLAPRAPGAPAAPDAYNSPYGTYVRWDPPDDDGGSPITGYEATAHPGGASCTTTGAETCAIVGLAPGSVVTFTVTATNAQGTGPPSAPSAPLLVPTAPDAPTGVIATPGPRRARFFWTPPAEDGGLEISSYRICVSTDPAVPAASASCTSTGWIPDASIYDLTAGETYYATVAATNAAGTGPASAPSAGVVPFTVPDAPAAPVLSAGSFAVSASWAPPAHDGGSPVTGYRVCTSADPSPPPAERRCVDVGTATSTTLTDLEAGTTHHVTVAAANVGGIGAPSPVGSITLAPAAPQPPQQVGVHPAADAVVVTWLPPWLTGGSPITSFRACTSTDPEVPENDRTCTTVAGGTSAEIGGLAPGSTYYARVSATNATGTSAESAATAIGAVPYTRPGAPVAPAALAGRGTATVAWAAPVDDGGSPVTGFLVTPHVGGQAQTPIAFGADEREGTLDGLAVGVEHRFTVQAVNAAGAGAESPPSNAVRPFDTPSPFASWDAFVARQLLDHTGDAGTVASRATTVELLDSGAISATGYIELLAADAWYRPNLAPAARLYWAYFRRIPDHDGLQYWTRRRRDGTTLIRISASFAGSSEFQRIYGSLDHGEFVDLVYRNVLGRDPDPGGRAFWIGRLQRGTSRGQVMINFSESSEYVAAMAGEIAVVEVVEAMLGRAPTAAEVDAWADEPRPDLIAHVLASDEYADRVS
ncbi:MAG: fibronectin type III domain-containing protein [Acidimicrobiales bacterium]|nr:fibronectin type III domain-containing protein [Acidimicrobiales bacterium]